MKTCGYAAPITAIQFLLDHVLLVGTGPFIKLYQITTGRLLYVENVLEHVNVHHLIKGNMIHTEKKIFIFILNRSYDKKEG
jgi:hypothetical protein